MVWQPDAVGLLPGDNVPGVSAIYETTGLGTASPQLRMVSVNNENTPLTTTTQGSKEDPYLGAATRTGHNGAVYQAISSDGQTVYFTAEPAGGGALTLYARTGDFAGGTPASPTTVTIAEGEYVGASADGSMAWGNYELTRLPFTSAKTQNGRTARKHHKKTKVKASVKDSNGSSSKTMTLKL
jgi:hypothetical protein